MASVPRNPLLCVEHDVRHWRERVLRSLFLFFEFLLQLTLHPSFSFAFSRRRNERGRHTIYFYEMEMNEPSSFFL
jgi:hypothetical protein